MDRFATLHDVELAYRTHGSGEGIPLLLIAGLGMQLIDWDEAFIDGLVARGYFVVRYDNRDVGLSTHLNAGRPAYYLLADMADDAAGLIDFVGLGSAHVLGISMGGMIAQTLAVRHPDRVRSLTSIMSTTGDPSVGRPTPAGLAALMSPPPRERTAGIDQTVRLHRAMGSPDFAFDADALRARVTLAWDRYHDPSGVMRQMAAIVASGDRTAALRELDVPALVMHGDADPLVDPSGGRATAAALRGSRFIGVPGMGHDLPAGMWPTLFDALDQLTSRA